MIKKSVFEEELIHGMQRELRSHEKKQGMQNLVKAADHLHSALEILEEAGLSVQANKILNILKKIAEDKPKASTKVSDKHTQGLTPDKMVNNLKQHGHVFNMADDGIDNNKADIEQPKSFDEDYRKWKRMQEEKNPKKKKVVVMDDIPIYVDDDSDDDSADDLLNAEIGDESLIVTEDAAEKTFEDSD